jgi:WD40 repeat protein
VSKHAAPPEDDSKGEGARAHATDNSVAVGGDNLGVIRVHHNHFSFSRPEPRKFDGECPYVGLQSFDEADAKKFFGREGLTTEVLKRLDRWRASFIVGPSGSGKSSLARAGLLHALRSGKRDAAQQPYCAGSERWCYLRLSPGRNPVEALALAVERVPLHGARISRPLGPLRELAELIRQRNHETNPLHRVAELLVSDHERQRVVCLVDQFEEVFTQVSSEDERRDFIKLLTSAIHVEKGPLTLVCVMRSDFVERCADYFDLNALLNRGFIQVGAMSTDDLRRAISLPAHHAGVLLQPELTDRIVADMERQAGGLPLMQFALTDLFEAEKLTSAEGRLTLVAYERRGGIGRCLERHADAKFAAFDAEERALARDIFKRLVQVRVGQPATRRNTTLHELTAVGTTSEKVSSVIHKLADARLITTDREWIRIAHERLFDAWPWLRRLIGDCEEAMAVQSRVADAARRWRESGGDESYLYQGKQLGETQRAIDTSQLSWNALELEFVQTSRRRQAKRRATAAALSLLVLLVLSAIAAPAWNNYRTARSQQAAAEALVSLDADPARGLQIALDAFDQQATPQAEDALRRSLLWPPLRRILRGHEQAVVGVAYSRDGTRLISVGADGKALIWDVSTGQPLPILADLVGVNAAAFSPKEDLAATAHEDAVARVWDASKGHQVHSLKHAGPVTTVSFSPDRLHVLTTSQDGSVLLWNLSTGEKHALPLASEGVVRSVAFSPNGDYVAAGVGRNIVLWDARTKDLIASRANHNHGEVESVHFNPERQQPWLLASSYYGAFALCDRDLRDACGWTREETLSPDRGHDLYSTSISFAARGSRKLATTGRDRTTRLWDAKTGHLMVTLRGHQESVTQAAFDPSGDHLATASADRTIRIWDLSAWRKRVLIGHSKRVFSVARSPDGSQIVTTEGDFAEAGKPFPDGSLKIWDAQTGVEQATIPYPEAAGFSARFHPSKAQLITAGDDGTVRLWDLVTMTQSAMFCPFADNDAAVTGSGCSESADPWPGVHDADFAPNGQQILTVGRGVGHARMHAILWDANTYQRLAEQPPQQRGGWLRRGIFSPKGNWTVTAGTDKTAKLWNLKTHATLVLAKHSELVLNAAFSLDEKFVVTSSADGTANIWETASGTWLRELRGHTGTINGLALSPDDSPVVATGSADGTARLWGMDGSEIAVLRGHTDEILALTFSKDGRHLYTGSRDGTARIYPVKTRDVVDLARSSVATGL